MADTEKNRPVDALPPLPKVIGRVFAADPKRVLQMPVEYIVNTIQAYARAAVEADRARQQDMSGRDSALRAEPAGQHTASTCAHVWPESGGQTDIYGKCEKCGMSFQRYIHTECP